MSIRTELCDLLDVEYPIVQGAMGRCGTVPLTAAVSEAGGFGILGCSERPQDDLREVREQLASDLDRVLEQTDSNFGFNVPIGTPSTAEWWAEGSHAYVEGILAETLTDSRLRDQLRVLETSGGNPELVVDDIAAVKEECELLHFHKVGSVRQAEKAASLGVDGITASGFEMAGHTHDPQNAISTFVLVPAIAEAVDVPVLASGGIRDGRGLMAAISLGAAGAYMGTRFLATQEHDWHEQYKELVERADEGADTVIEGIISPIRCLDTPAVDEAQEKLKRMDREAFSKFEDERMVEARVYGDEERGLFVAGQSAGYIDDRPTVEELLARMIEEAETIQQRIRTL